MFGPTPSSRSGLTISPLIHLSSHIYLVTINHFCYNVNMLTNSDKDDIRDLIREELDRVENKIDKVLSIVTRTDQEH